MQLESARINAINILRESLPAYLTYHSVDHTLDVYRESLRIAQAENVTSEEDLSILLTAASYHDIGFVVSEMNHEQQSCIMCMKQLPRFGYNDTQISMVCDLVMATKLPQSPGSHLAQILCDADLDYLGRQDFEEISGYLYDEFLYRKIVKDFESWNHIQVNFFNAHRYFTKTNQELRSYQKAQNLNKIIESIKQNG